jgi:hypothetical protein
VGVLALPEPEVPRHGLDLSLQDLEGIDVLGKVTVAINACVEAVVPDVRLLGRGLGSFRVGAVAALGGGVARLFDRRVRICAGGCCIRTRHVIPDIASYCLGWAGLRGRAL